MGSGFGRNKQEYDQLRRELEQTYPSCYIKTIMRHNNPTFIEYNSHLIKLIGSNPNEIATRLFNEGIIEYEFLISSIYNLNRLYPNAQKRYANSVELFLRLLFNGSYDGTPVEKPEELYHRDGYVIFQ